MMYLLDYLQSKTKDASSELAVVEAESGQSITYRELWEEVYKLSRGLKSLGLEKHDRVAVALPNGIDWVVSFFATLSSGGVVVSVLQSATPHEAKWLINKTKPAMFIGDSAFINRSLPFDLFEEDQTVVVRSKRIILKSKTKKRIHHLPDLLKATVRFPKEEYCETRDASEIATITFTYRGFGYPLGAMMSHGNYIEGIKAYLHTVESLEKKRFLAILPFSYSYPLVGTILAPLATASTIVTARGIMPHKVLDIVRNYSVNVLTAIPSFYTTLLSSRISDPSHLNVTHALCGGSLMPVGLYQKMKDVLNVSLRQGYGLTECLPVTCNPSNGNRPDTLGNVSLGSKGMEVRISGEGDVEKSIGETGEIAVAGPTVMKGYYGMPKETNEVLRNGWLYTGDMGWFDSDGYLHFAGVKKRIAKVGGHMVDLAEVEDRLLHIPGVCSAKAYAVSNDRWGQIIGADIMSLNGNVDSRQIRHYLKQYLATYKLPKIIQSLS